MEILKHIFSDAIFCFVLFLIKFYVPDFVGGFGVFTGILFSLNILYLLFCISNAQEGYFDKRFHKENIKFANRTISLWVYDIATDILYIIIFIVYFHYVFAPIVLMFSLMAKFYGKPIFNTYKIWYDAVYSKLLEFEKTKLTKGLK